VHRAVRIAGASDAEALLEELSHPAVGLSTEEELSAEPALKRVVALVREQVARLRRGEVDTKRAEQATTDDDVVVPTVSCPHCGTELAAQALRGNYCDSPNCGAPPSWRCPNPGCDFDLCETCYELAGEAV
jgi:hypothetical protein